MTEQKRFSPRRFFLDIDGKPAGFLRSVAGGIIKGEVATETLGTSNFPKKHLATISHEPLTMEVGLGMGQEFWEWIKASFDKGFVRKTAELSAQDFNGNMGAVRVFNEARISELTFPAMDGSSKEPGYFTVKITPETIRYEKGGGVRDTSSLPSKKWLASNFRFELGDLPCERVAKIDSFTWKQTIVRDELGDFRDASPTSTIEVPNLKLTISMADLEPWQDWYQSFVIDGKCTDSDELTGAITFLSSDMQSELGNIALHHVGIISLDPAPSHDAGEGVARFEVELYVEQMTFEGNPD